MRQTIAILEDNADRITVMDQCLADKFPFFERRFFRTAAAAIEWLRDHLSRVICVSLDHDLEPGSVHDADPGTGRQVADFLTANTSVCPVILHTTNSVAGDGMELALSEAGWRVARITPYEGCRWIAEAWMPLVRNAIVNAVVEPLAH